MILGAEINYIPSIYVCVCVNRAANPLESFVFSPTSSTPVEKYRQGEFLSRGCDFFKTVHDGMLQSHFHIVATRPSFAGVQNSQSDCEAADRQP